MLYRTLGMLFLIAGFSSFAGTAQPPAKLAGITFRVKMDPKIVGTKPESGRVLVGLAKPRQRIDFTRTDPPVLPILGTDAEAFSADSTVVLDNNSATFPLVKLNDLPAGDYTIQAIFATNRDINLPNAPGNRFSTPVTVKLDPATGATVDLMLDRVYEEPKPKDTATVKYLKLPSKLLSDFHGRPMFFRVGVILPPSYEKETKQYGLVVNIGGFGTRYTSAGFFTPDPRFVQILPDGAGPFGDPYQVDSDNNGPYGAALTQEVIPHIEKSYRCLCTPKSRFTTGASTGGWVSLALQIFYADYFNGCWSQCPDPVTFERFELIDIYKDANAYVNKYGFDRPSKRTIDSDVVFTVRHECQIENVLGRGGRWELSGRDWCCWNATYGPRGKDGLPVPLWDGKTGVIDRTVLEHWRRYDLKQVLEQHWQTLGPKLAGGKINLWVGESDDYFLNVAVHKLKESLAKQNNPRFDGSIVVELRKQHGEGGWTRKEMLDAMANRAGLK